MYYGGQRLIPIYYNSLTIDNTAGGTALPAAALSSTTYGRTIMVIGTLETAQVRFTIDGSTAPTTTVGHILEVGEILTLEGAEVGNFKGIRTGGTSGALKYTCYGKDEAILSL